MAITILDGPIGSELEKLGVTIPAPWWTAWTLKHYPESVAEVHKQYVAAGATVHTTCTFRTRRRNIGDEWHELAARAVRLARGAVPPDHRVAGSLAPLDHCYRPDLSPKECRQDHRELARALAAEGVDILLCETFPNIDEALVAVEECVATGIETWVSFTSGPENNLLTASELEAGAREAVLRGASAVLANCIPASHVLPYVERLSRLGVSFGAYGSADSGNGQPQSRGGPEEYADLAALWVEAGASTIGSCCGTGPAYIAELKRRFG